MLRESLRAELARDLVGMLFKTDRTQAELASATGATATIVQRWCDRDRPETLSLPDVVLAARASPALALEMVRWATDRLGLTVAPRLADAAGPVDHIQHAALMAREHSECLGAVLEAHADGVVDDAELERIDRELRDVEAAYAQLRGWVESERRRRGRPLRAVGA